MAKNEIKSVFFTSVARAAAEDGYLKLSTDGALLIDAAAPAKIKTYLNRYLDKEIHEQSSLKKSIRKDGLTGESLANILEEMRLEAEREAKLAAARVQMTKFWDHIGGPKSLAGLPVGQTINVTRRKGLGKAKSFYEADFRGGPMKIMENGTFDGVAQEFTSVNISLKGIECQIRQEKTDEIYGVISVFGPSSNLIVTKRVPAEGIVSFGPKGLRIVSLDLPLVVEGVMQNYVVVAALIENDSGDVDVIARKVADKLSSAAAAAIGAATGVPAEAVADSESFKENLVTGFAWVFGNVLGMGDDAYNPGTFDIPWAQIQQGSFPVQPTVRRNDDPRTISTWTHQLILSGRDDAGDIGQYSLYFNVSTTKVIKTFKQ